MQVIAQLWCSQRCKMQYKVLDIFDDCKTDGKNNCGGKWNGDKKRGKFSIRWKYREHNIKKCRNSSLQIIYGTTWHWKFYKAKRKKKV